MNKFQNSPKLQRCGNTSYTFQVKTLRTSTLTYIMQTVWLHGKLQGTSKNNAVRKTYLIVCIMAIFIPKI